MRPVVHALLVVAVALALGACHGGKDRGLPRHETAVLKIVCDVPDAEIWIDDRVVGQVRDIPPGGAIRLRPGLHRLEVRHDRYHTRYHEITLEKGQELTVTVTLAEVLD